MIAIPDDLWGLTELEEGDVADVLRRIAGTVMHLAPREVRTTMAVNILSRLATAHEEQAPRRKRGWYAVGPKDAEPVFLRWAGRAWVTTSGRTGSVGPNDIIRPVTIGDPE